MATDFTKEYTSPKELVALLRERGLEFEDADRAESYIRNIGYYRFSAYLFPLLASPKEQHRFKPDSRFADAIALYRFDKKLRPFYDICIIKWFIDIISPRNDMKQHLLDLLHEYPMVDTHAMGFPDDWEREPLWME